MKTNLKDERQETRSEKINHLKEMFFKKIFGKILGSLRKNPYICKKIEDVKKILFKVFEYIKYPR